MHDSLRSRDIFYQREVIDGDDHPSNFKLASFRNNAFFYSIASAITSILYIIYALVNYSPFYLNYFLAALIPDIIISLC